MPAISASAPGKVILFGEHAVVYGQPAIAVPVSQVSAKAIITPDIQGAKGSIRIVAPAIGLDAQLTDLPKDDPLGMAVSITLNALGIKHAPAFQLRVNSAIPLAAGLGSGAAISVAVIRAVSSFLGHPFTDEKVSELAYEIEKLHHGTPSGIDNSVITFAMPVFFIRDQPIQFLKVPKPFSLVIGDTGVVSPTRATVDDVRASWESQPAHYDQVFEAIGKIAQEAREAIEKGKTETLGPLMKANHGHLQALDVSSHELDTLVKAAEGVGSLGAKLSGGGRGGNMIALTPEGKSEIISSALKDAGATNTIVTTVQ